eukprot:TRINITY_DN35800_c0_g2_i1.p1 TRINITY_DN35800_c0_g2~~TRINITY_DN35800_c0_g2_i1.p1  ORF type:complete len:487 (+),score=74.41 TRINITY_DN35800_c0_g2_i1:33-1463(+)
MDASINHPSVIMWGFLNEGETRDLRSRPTHAHLAQFARTRDPSRLVSWASRHKMKDLTLDLADVISFNDYPGWYDTSVNEIPSIWQSYADWVRENYPGKPFLAAEAGSSGLAGFRRPPSGGTDSDGMEMWSEDLQAAIVGSTVAAISAAGFAGVALWQFADCRIDVAPFLEDNPPGIWDERDADKLPEPPMFNASNSTDWVEQVAVGYQVTNSPFGLHMPLRPRGLNNKGLLSLSRQHRKLSFWAAREAFHGYCNADGLPVASRIGQPPRVPAPARGWSSVKFESFGAPFAAQRTSQDQMMDRPPVGCIGCVLAVHTWNVADLPEGEPGARVHAHTLEARASHWELQPGGFLRLVGHTDGRETASGGFLTVGQQRDDVSSYVAVRAAAFSLWQVDLVPGRDSYGPDQLVLLRVAFGPMCGGYLSMQAGDLPADARDDKSVYAVVHMDPNQATAWRVHHVASQQTLPATGAFPSTLR